MNSRPDGVKHPVPPTTALILENGERRQGIEIAVALHVRASSPLVHPRPSPCFPRETRTPPAKSGIHHARLLAHRSAVCRATVHQGRVHSFAVNPPRDESRCLNGSPKPWHRRYTSSQPDPSAPSTGSGRRRSTISTGGRCGTDPGGAAITAVSRRSIIFESRASRTTTIAAPTTVTTSPDNTGTTLERVSLREPFTSADHRCSYATQVSSVAGTRRRKPHAEPRPQVRHRRPL